MNVPRYKIVYCTPALYSAGGVERIVTTKANYFADIYGYDVTIIVTEGSVGVSFFPLSQKVKIVNLGINYEELWNKPFWGKVILYLRKQYLYRIKLNRYLMEIHPDFVISTLRREVNFLCSIKDGSVKIGELHLSRANYRGYEIAVNNVAKRFFSRWWKRDAINRFRKLDRLVVLTEQALYEWPELNNVTMIPNPLTVEVYGISDLNSKRVIAVGRYSYEKGFDMLLHIWSIVEKRCMDWELDIYAMGDPTPYVKLLTELGIDRNRCRLNASIVNVGKEYLRSSILVQPSRYEGFGLVALEAMAFGLPVVAFDCGNGPQSIITNKVDGFLIKPYDIDKFAECVLSLIDSYSLRKEMADNGQKKVERYQMERVANQWKKLFDELIIKR